MPLYFLSDADLVIPENKFVSTVHCVFVKGEGGRAHIKDTSTNGTLLNGSRLERNVEVSSFSDVNCFPICIVHPSHPRLPLSVFCYGLLI